jgi:hypothetical protein
MDLSRGIRVVVAVAAILVTLSSAGLVSAGHVSAGHVSAAKLVPRTRDGDPQPARSQPSAVERVTLDAPRLRVPAMTMTSPPPDVPARGSGQFVLAGGASPRVGSGRVYRYRVVVELGSPVSPADFAAAVDVILSDPRSWIASRRWGFQRVSMGSSDFTVHLATPATTDVLCSRVGVTETGGEVSCRGGRTVVINLKRWLLAVPWYADAIEAYRQMVVNHEVGHFLGWGHMGCPGAGRPAPVMQQQTLGLQTCARNPWPYPDGRTFVTGPAKSP